MQTRTMYIEAKVDGLTGPARVGRIRFSKTGKTLYYRTHRFQSLRGRDLKANYVDLETGETYWISGCRRDGHDTLYPGVVEIDEDVRVEYWRDIRERPDLAEQSSFRSPGKHRTGG
ncbi:MAG: hypothetical protein RLO52_20960 [Sandaracinaceae bacterium]